MTHHPSSWRPWRLGERWIPKSGVQSGTPNAVFRVWEPDHPTGCRRFPCPLFLVRSGAEMTLRRKSTMWVERPHHMPLDQSDKCPGVWGWNPQNRREMVHGRKSNHQQAPHSACRCPPRRRAEGQGAVGLSSNQSGSHHPGNRYLSIGSQPLTRINPGWVPVMLLPPSGVTTKVSSILFKEQKLFQALSNERCRAVTGMLRASTR